MGAELPRQQTGKRIRPLLQSASGRVAAPARGGKPRRGRLPRLRRGNSRRDLEPAPGKPFPQSAV